MRFASALFRLSVLLLLVASAAPLWAQCTLSTTDPSVTICLPGDNSTVANPVHITAGTTDSAATVKNMQVWIDGVKTYETSGGKLDTYLTLATGTRRIAVVANDSAGRTFKAVVNANVTAGASTLTVTISNPTNGSTNPNPVNVVASAAGPNPISLMQVWFNGSKVYEVKGSSINTNLTLTVGSNERFVVQAIDSTGASAKVVESINVTAGSGGGGSNTVTISSPTDGSTDADPVHVVASASTVNPISRIELWLDSSQKAFSTYASSNVDTQLTLQPGSHKITVQAIDSSNNVYKSYVSVNVTSPAAGDVAGLKANVRHIIFLLQENRSLDNYFGQMDDYRQMQGASPGSFDGIPPGAVQYDSAASPVYPFHFRTVCHENVSPSWNESHSIWNYGKMDRFVKVAQATTSSIDPRGHRAMGYYDWTDLPFYYDAAWQFATSDRWFTPVMSGTNVNRLYSFAASSFGHIRPDTPPSGGWTYTNIFDRLKAAGITWRVYTQDQTNEWALWANYDSTHVKNISSWASDVQNESALPQVIFIDRGGSTGLDEHPGSNIQTGAADVASIVNTLMNSPSWGSSIFLLSYDEFGGLYDHVQPQFTVLPDSIAPMLQTGDWNATFNQTGYRVPLIVFSPFAKAHYVSHTAMDYTSILKLIETRFTLAPLSARDAVTPDMLEFFNFSSPSWSTPPSLASQPTNGTCDNTLETGP